MSLKDWMKKVELSSLNEATQTIMLPTMKPGTTTPSGEQTALAIDTSKPGANVLAAALGAKQGSSTTVVSPNSPVKAIAAQNTAQPITNQSAQSQQNTQQGAGNQGGLQEDDEQRAFEAHGVHGMKSKPWRKVFKNQAQFEKWLEKNEGNVEVFGTRDLEQPSKMDVTEGTKNAKTNTALNESALEEIIANHPHEHKMCQEGWGMDNSLYEALADHYFKEGRIPRSVWHGSAEGLREFVEDCYIKDTMGANEDMINSGMLDEVDVAEGSVMYGEPENKESFRVTYYDPKYNEQRTSIIKSRNETAALDFCSGKGYDVLNIQQQGVAEGYLDDEDDEPPYRTRILDRQTKKIIADEGPYESEDGAVDRAEAYLAWAETKNMSIVAQVYQPEYGKNYVTWQVPDEGDYSIKEQGVAEGSKEKTPGIALSKAYKKDFDDKKPGHNKPETALTGTYSKTGKPGGELKKQGVAEGSLNEFGGGGYPPPPKYKVGDSVLVKGYQGVGKIAYIKHRGDVGVVINEPTNQRVVTTIDDLVPKKGVAEGSKEDFTMNARGADPRLDKYATDSKPGVMNKVGSALRTGANKVINTLGGPDYEQLKTHPPGTLDEEMSPLERSLRQSTKENTMYEGKKTRSVAEATEKTKSGLKHKADAGGYGRKHEDDTDDNGKKVKSKADEPKKGRGRPKKTDTTSGEDKKFDTGSLSDVFGSKKPAKEIGKLSVKKRIKTKDDSDEELDESKLKGGQKKLDINKNGKLDKADFSMLSNQKKKKDAQMESWERQLNGLLTEGITVSTSVGQEGGQDSVSINASDADAHKLLQILQNAGMGSGVPSHVISGQSSPAQATTDVSPSIATGGGSADSEDIEGSGGNVSSMPMPRGMAFSVQPEETDVPTEPEEFGVVDSEEVFDTLGKEYGQSEKTDNGDDALSFLKKAIGHGTEYADGKQEVTTDNTPAQESPAVEQEGEEFGSEGSEVEESDEDGKKSDEGSEETDDSVENDKEDDKEEKVEESAQPCNECGMNESECSCSMTESRLFTKLLKVFEDAKSDFADIDDDCDKEESMKKAAKDKKAKKIDEWANSPQDQGKDEQFDADMAFMTKVISGGLNGQKSTGQATAPVIASQTNRQMNEGYNVDVSNMLKKLAGIK